MRWGDGGGSPGSLAGDPGGSGGVKDVIYCTLQRPPAPSHIRLPLRVNLIFIIADCANKTFSLYFLSFPAVYYCHKVEHLIDRPAGP